MEWGQLRGEWRTKAKIWDTSEGIAGVYACDGQESSLKESGVKTTGGLRPWGLARAVRLGRREESVMETEMFDGSQESQVWEEGGEDPRGGETHQINQEGKEDESATRRLSFQRSFWKVVEMDAE